jgi:hypothetical protein
MSIKTLLAALVLTAAPGLAMAECSWGMEHQTTMSCAEGTHVGRIHARPACPWSAADPATPNIPRVGPRRRAVFVS